MIGVLDDGACSASGNVVDASYSGPHTELTIETAEVGTLKIAKRGDEDHDLDVGDVASVSWPASASWLVPDPPAVEDVQQDSESPGPRVGVAG